MASCSSATGTGGGTEETTATSVTSTASSETASIATSTSTGAGAGGSTSSASTTGSSSDGSGGAGLGNDAGAGGDGQGGRHEPTGEECLAITNRDDCEAAGCLVGWHGVELERLENGRCVYESGARCLQATSLTTPGGVTSAWWWIHDGVPEVFDSSSYCDYVGLHPCLGDPDQAYPDEPDGCRCALSPQQCGPFPDGPP